MRVDSAGIVLYRRGDGTVEVLIAHPGGPFWASKDEGAWSIPKGEPEPGEEPYATARREFTEETGFAIPNAPPVDLGTTRLKSGKLIAAWALEGDADPDALDGNHFTLEWPPRSGRRSEFPEIDRVAWCDPREAVRRLNPAQAVFVERLLAALSDG